MHWDPVEPFKTQGIQGSGACCGPPGDIFWIFDRQKHHGTEGNGIDDINWMHAPKVWEYKGIKVFCVSWSDHSNSIISYNKPKRSNHIIAVEAL